MCARVFRAPSRDRVIAALAAHARRLAERPEVLSVVLFGSVARGEHTGHSDADLLVLVGSSPLPFPERSPAYAPSEPPLPVDTFVYTLRESLETPLARRALAEGIVLYDRRGKATPGSP